MKKFIALLICAVMLFTFTACLGASDVANDNENSGVKEASGNEVTEEAKELPVSGVEGSYKFDEYSDHIVLTEYIGKTPNPYIPDTINGKPVTEFGTIFKGNLNLRGLTIGKYCTGIVDNAFENCYNLQRVEIVDGVTSIGSNAFFGCHSLELIYIPACVKTIAEDAFPYITGLIIYGEKGSAAEAFEKIYASIYFLEISDAEESETEPVTESATESTAQVN